MSIYTKDDFNRDSFEPRRLYNSFIKYTYENIFPLSIDNPTSDEAADLLYHYTSLDGFMGIMNSGCLWAGNIHFLNDYREYEDGRENCLKALERYMEKENNPEHRQYLGRIHFLIKDNQPDEMMHQSIDNIFSASFCRNGDLLSQWRGYGQNSGVAIGFDLQALRGAMVIPESKYQYSRDHKISLWEEGDEKNSPDQLIPSEVKWVSVEYSDAEKQKHFEGLLDNFLKALDTGEQQDFADQYSLENRAQTSAQLLRTSFPMMKNDGFVEEAECRMIAHYTEEDKVDISYRTSGGIIIPYINFRLLDYHGKPFHTVLPVRRIVVGPGYNQETTCQSIRYFLTHQAKPEQMGLKKLAEVVQKSKIPFR